MPQHRALAMPYVVAPLAFIKGGLSALLAHDVPHATLSASLSVLKETLVEAPVSKLNLSVSIETSLAEVPIEHLPLRVIGILISAPLRVYVYPCNEFILHELSSAHISILFAGEVALAMAEVLIPLAFVEITVEVEITAAPLLLAFERLPHVDVSVYVFNLTVTHVFDLSFFSGELPKEDFSIRGSEHSV